MLVHIGNKRTAGTDVIGQIERTLLSQDMAAFQCKLMESVREQGNHLSETEIQLYKRGKKIRPMLLMLSARLIAGEQNCLPENVITGAVALEMLHVATLIHDDIIDGAESRRGVPSVNQARGTSEAIIVGDIQFLGAVQQAMAAVQVEKDKYFANMMLDTAMQLCYGELDEMKNPTRMEPDILKERYLRIINRKTAVLFQLSMEAGIILAGGGKNDAHQTGLYGLDFGRSFQIMDDLLDFSMKAEDAGKQQGMDLNNIVLTLPVINALQTLSKEDSIKKTILYGSPDPEERRKAALYIRNCEGFLAAYQEARRYMIRALRYLENFEDTPYKKALQEIGFYVINRG